MMPDTEPAPRTIVVVDTETSGLDATKDALLEVSWAVVDVATAQTVELHSHLLRGHHNAAEAVNGISPQALELGCEGLPNCVPTNAVCVGHNVSFDRAFLERAGWVAKEWLCAKEDWRWPRKAPTMRLVDLALAHGIGVVAAHRAYSDVLTLCALLARVHELGQPLEAQLAFARLPRRLFVSLAPFEARETVRAAGFSWEPSARRWTKRLLPEEASRLPFRVRPATP